MKPWWLLLSPLYIAETREERVGSWRNFASNKKKKQKTKPAVLG